MDCSKLSDGQNDGGQYLAVAFKAVEIFVKGHLMAGVQPDSPPSLRLRAKTSSLLCLCTEVSGTECFVFEVSSGGTVRTRLASCHRGITCTNTDSVAASLAFFTPLLLTQLDFWVSANSENAPRTKPAKHLFLQGQLTVRAQQEQISQKWMEPLQQSN